MRIQPFFLICLTILFALPAHAINLGSETNNISGINAFGTPVGVYGTVAPGNNEQSGGTLSDLVGQGGNAATVCFPNVLAPAAALFTMTATGASCGASGTQIAIISATNAQGVCDDLQSLNQGCNWRNQACTHNGDPGFMFDVVAPFLCTLTHWEFLTATVPATSSTVDITGVTDPDASIVDYFSINVGGTLIEADAGSFSGVSNLIQLESVLEALSGLFNVTLNGTTLTFTATSTGPITLTNLRLEFITPATFATVDVDGITNEIANVVNRFSLNINGSNASTSGLDFSAVTNGIELAAVLNTVSGIDVTYNGGSNRIVISASTAGATTFSNVLLASVPELSGSVDSLDYHKRTSPVVVDGALTVGPAGSENYVLTGAVVSLDLFSDEEALDFTPASGINGTYDVASGVLNLSGQGTRSDYLSVLQTVNYYNSNGDKTSETRQVRFLLTDADHTSAEFIRIINVIANPFPWSLFLTK